MRVYPMFKRPVISFLAALFFTHNAHTEIIKIKSMKSVEDKFAAIMKEYNSKDVLGIFDIHLTLVSPTHPASNFANITDIHGNKFTSIHE